MASPPLPTGPTPNLSNFQFKMIGRQPALLNRLSALSNADARLSSPPSPLEDSEDEARPEASSFASVPLTRPSLLQALSLDADVPMSDSTVPAKGAQKIDTCMPENTVPSDKIVSQSSRLSDASGRLTNSPSTLLLNHFHDGNRLPSDSPRLQYPAGANAESQLQTPTRTPSPLSIKKELSSSKAFFPAPDTNLNAPPIFPSTQPSSHSSPSQSPVTQSDQLASATMSTSTSTQASCTPFVSLKNMHAFLLSSITSLSQATISQSDAISSSNYVSHDAETSVEQQKPIESVSNTITTALSLVKYAHTLAESSLHSAEEASKVASASLSAAKVSFDAITKATNLVEEAASSVDEKVAEWRKKEIELKEKTAELQEGLTNLGEWIKDREKDRAKRIQLRDEAREREAREREAKELEERVREAKLLEERVREASEQQAKNAAATSQREASIVTVGPAATEVQDSMRTFVEMVDMTMVHESASTSLPINERSQEDNGNNESRDELNTASVPSPLDEYLRHEEENLRHLREVEAVAKRARENAENVFEQRRREEVRRKKAEEEERQKRAAEHERQRKLEEERKRKQEAAEQERQRQMEEERKRRQEAAEQESQRRMEEERRRRQEAAEQERQRQMEEERRRKQEAAEQERQRQMEEEQKRKQEAAEQERQRRMKEERNRIAAQEEAERRRRQAEEEEGRRKAIAEEAAKLRLQAEEEKRRRQVEEQKREAERAEKLRLQAEEERQRQAEEQKREAERAEKLRLQAEEEERQRHAAEEQLRLDTAQAEAALRQELDARAQQERRRAEISEARKLDQHETALKIRADRARRGGSVTSPDVEHDASPTTTLAPRASRPSTPTVFSSSSLNPVSHTMATSASPPAQIQDVSEQTSVPASSSPAFNVPKLSKKERKRAKAALREQQQSEVVVSGGVKLGTNSSTLSSLRVGDLPSAINDTQGPSAPRQPLSTPILPTVHNSQTSAHSQLQLPGTSSQSPTSTEAPMVFTNSSDTTDSVRIPITPFSSQTNNVTRDVQATNLRFIMEAKGKVAAGGKKHKPAPAYNIPLIKKEESNDDDASSILQQASQGPISPSSNAQPSTHPPPTPVSHPPLTNMGSASFTEGQSSVAREPAPPVKPRNEPPSTRKPGSVAAKKAAPTLTHPLPPQPVNTRTAALAPPTGPRADSPRNIAGPSALPQAQLHAAHPSAEEVRDRVLRCSPISPDLPGDGGWNGVWVNDDGSYQSTSGHMMSERETYSDLPNSRDAYPAQNSRRSWKGYDHYSPPRARSPRPRAAPSRSPSPNRSARVYGDNIRPRTPCSPSPPPPRRPYRNAGPAPRGDRYVPARYNSPPPGRGRRSDSPSTPPPPVSSHSGMKRPRESDQTDLPPARRSFNPGSDYDHPHASDWPASPHYPPRNSSSPPLHDSHHPPSLESRLGRSTYDNPSGMTEHVSYDGTIQAGDFEDQPPRVAPNANKQRQNRNIRQQQESGMRPGLLSRLGNAPQQQQQHSSGGAAKSRGQAQRTQGKGRGRGGGPGDRSQMQPRQLSQRLQSAGGNTPLLSRLRG